MSRLPFSDIPLALIGIFWLAWLGTAVPIGIASGSGLAAAGIGLGIALIVSAVAEKLLPDPPDEDTPNETRRDP